MKAFFSAMAFFFGFIAFAVPANAMDISVGVTGGLSAPDLKCAGCPKLEVATTAQYGVDARVLTQVFHSVKFGAELAGNISSASNLEASGKKVGTTGSQRLSLVPMVATNFGKAVMYVGVGISASELTVNHSTDKGIGYLSKIGFDYPIYKNVSAGLQVEHGLTRYNGGMDSSCCTAKARLAYSF